MNRAPTWVRPAANGYRLGQHAVLPLPRDSGRVADASLPFAIPATCNPGLPPAT